MFTRHGASEIHTILTIIEKEAKATVIQSDGENKDVEPGEITHQPS